MMLSFVLGMLVGGILTSLGFIAVRYRTADSSTPQEAAFIYAKSRVPEIKTTEDTKSFMKFFREFLNHVETVHVVPQQDARKSKKMADSRRTLLMVEIWNDDWYSVLSNVDRELFPADTYNYVCEHYDLGDDRAVRLTFVEPKRVGAGS